MGYCEKLDKDCVSAMVSRADCDDYLGRADENDCIHWNVDKEQYIRIKQYIKNREG